MKTLNLHCDYIKFKGLKKALKDVDEIAPKQELEGSSKECLVVMIAVEKQDGMNLVPVLVENIKNILSQVKSENVVLYPYAHLSSNLGSPRMAVDILNEAKKELSKEFKVISAPFGYYKEFELKVKGHPLSELSRELNIKGNEVLADISVEERKRLLHEISKSRLDISKLKENDHRILGQQMDLWSFNAVAPGMVFWHPKGFHIRTKLIELWRELHRKAGYQEISTPQIMDRKLWEISGHWSKYGENNFKTNYEGRDLLVKPMNCPGGMLVYKTTPKSYKDLPLRVGELGNVHRVELSGVLAGLFRVIQFTQDDAHIFCKMDQLESEITKVMNLIKELFGYFPGLEFDHIELSTRPEKRVGAEELWDISEKTLEDVLKKSKVKYKLNPGDGAFYGPKIDFHLKDSLGRTWQCSTIQLDMALPERFDLTYTDEKGQDKRPVMLHRVIYGSLERFIGIITEQFDGKFPLWLSPNQVKVLTLNDSVIPYAKKVYQKLFDEGIQVELDDRSESMGKKALEARTQKFNYVLTVGEKEEKDKTVAIKTRDGKEIIVIKLDEFVSQIKDEIKTRK